MSESISNSVFAITSSTPLVKSGGARAGSEPFREQLGRAQSSQYASSDSDSDVKRTRKTEQQDSQALPNREPRERERTELAPKPETQHDKGEEDTPSPDGDETTVIVEIAVATSEVPPPVGISGEVVVDAAKVVESSFDTDEGALPGSGTEDLNTTTNVVTTEESQETTTQSSPVAVQPNGKQESVEDGQETATTPENETSDRPLNDHDASLESDTGDNKRRNSEQPNVVQRGDAAISRQATKSSDDNYHLVQSNQTAVETIAKPGKATSATASVTAIDDLEPADPNTDIKSSESTSKTDAAKTGGSADVGSLTDRAGRLLRGVSESTEADSSRGIRTDAARFVSRVSKAFQAAQENGGTIRLRLSPPELGALRIELSVQQGVLSARMETENPAARAILLDNLPALRERLAEQQIRVDQFHVDVGGGQHDGSPDWEAARDEASQRENRPATNERQREEQPAEPTPVRSILTDDGRFNAVA